MSYQKGKLRVATKEGFTIELSSGEHYTGKGDKLQFKPESIKYISDVIKRYNKEVASMKKQFRADRTDFNAEIQSA